MDWLFEAGWNLRTQWFKYLTSKAEPGGIVFAGDSLTQEFPIHEILALNKDTMLFDIHNRGIGGDTTSGLIRRINESIIDLNPSKLFLLIGTNDISYLEDDFTSIYEGISNIIDRTLAACSKTEIFLISLYPVNAAAEGMDLNCIGKRSNAKIDLINGQLKKIAAAKDIGFIDMNCLLKDEEGNLRLEYTREGLHISPLGYEVIMAEIMKYIKE